MSVPAWPATLPQTLIMDGYGEAPGENQLRSNMEVGPAKMRRRATSAARKVSGSLILTLAQLAYFKTFYNTTLLGGTLRFTWLDPTDSTTTVEMRFSKTPSWVAEDIHFRVSMSLEILP
jgi:hypothetical protein